MSTTDDSKGTVKQLVKDGVWQVPPAERPKGWEAMPVREALLPVQETAVAVIEQPVTTMVATAPEQLPDLQVPLEGWAEKKLEEARAEYAELNEAAEVAKKQKWNTRALKNAAAKAMARCTFYDKVVAALKAGFMLFPPVPNADCIAVRTPASQVVEQERQTSDWDKPQPLALRNQINSRGVGTYKNPNLGWTLWRQFKDDKGNDRKEWHLITALKDAVFPLSMAKPEILVATNAAMEMKIFDEIRLFPSTRQEMTKGDPCILGVVNSENRRLYFLISWRINQSDL